MILAILTMSEVFTKTLFFSETRTSSSTVSGCQKPKFLEKLNKASESYDKFKIGDIMLITMCHTSLYDFGDYDDGTTFHAETCTSSSTVSGCQNPTFLEKLNKTFIKFESIVQACMILAILTSPQFFTKTLLFCETCTCSSTVRGCQNPKFV